MAITHTITQSNKQAGILFSIGFWDFVMGSKSTSHLRRKRNKRSLAARARHTRIRQAREKARDAIEKAKESLEREHLGYPIVPDSLNNTSNIKKIQEESQTSIFTTGDHNYTYITPKEEFGYIPPYDILRDANDCHYIKPVDKTCPIGDNSGSANQHVEESFAEADMLEVMSYEYVNPRKIVRKDVAHPTVENIFVDLHSSRVGTREIIEEFADYVRVRYIDDAMRRSRGVGNTKQRVNEMNGNLESFQYQMPKSYDAIKPEHMKNLASVQHCFELASNLVNELQKNCKSIKDKLFDLRVLIMKLNDSDMLDNVSGVLLLNSVKSIMDSITEKQQ